MLESTNWIAKSRNLQSESRPPAMNRKAENVLPAISRVGLNILADQYQPCSHL